jgi:hypothetical protein
MAHYGCLGKYRITGTALARGKRARQRRRSGLDPPAPRRADPSLATSTMTSANSRRRRRLARRSNGAAGLKRYSRTLGSARTALAIGERWRRLSHAITRRPDIGQLPPPPLLIKFAGRTAPSRECTGIDQAARARSARIINGGTISIAASLRRVSELRGDARQPSRSAEPDVRRWLPKRAREVFLLGVVVANRRDHPRSRARQLRAGAARQDAAWHGDQPGRPPEPGQCRGRLARAGGAKLPDAVKRAANRSRPRSARGLEPRFQPPADQGRRDGAVPVDCAIGGS